MVKSFEVEGSVLVGLQYKPLFPYFHDHKNAFVILAADFVDSADGTGSVHMAPAFGEDDYALCKQNNIDIVCPVNASGKFTNAIPDLEYKLVELNEVLSLSGKQVFETNNDIIKYLKSKDLWLHTEQYVHNYPHCWRTDTPLIYMAMSSWYVEVTKIKDRMVELNKDVNWIPNHVRDGIFGKWIANARDWSISRHRFWGCPVPVWRSNDSRYDRIDVYGSIKDLENDFGPYYEQQNGKKLVIHDLHRPFIDTLKRPNPNDPTGKSMMIRVEDVLDCWFESGAMPYASIHYPFDYVVNGVVERNAEENKKWFDAHSPADFIVEYMAQVRGWFYSLTVLSVALFDRIPFRNCICHGVVLDDKSQKLSKRLQNYVDPLLVLKSYGSDTMRFALVSTSIMRGNSLNIDLDGKIFKDSFKGVILSFWNAFSFFKIYFESDFRIALSNKNNKLNQALFTGSIESDNCMDIYILTKLRHTIEVIKKSMDAYDTIDACNAVMHFINVLNNWYIRRNRYRFWSNKTLKADEYNKLSEMNDSNEDALLISKLKLSPNAAFRIQQDEQNNTFIVIDDSKYLAYQTLYTVLLRFSKAVAPLLPCISDVVYLWLNSYDYTKEYEHAFDANNFVNK